MADKLNLQDLQDPQDPQDPKKKKRVGAVDRVFPIEEPIKTHAQVQHEEAQVKIQDRTGFVGTLQEGVEFMAMKLPTTLTGLGIMKIASPSFTPDNSYRMSEDFMRSISLTVPREHQQYILASESEEEAKWRYTDVQGRLKNEAHLAEYGFGGNVVGLLTDLLDPSMLATFGVGVKVANVAMGAKTLTAAEMAQARGIFNSKLRAAGITEAQLRADLEAVIKATGSGAKTVQLSDEYYKVIAEARAAGMRYLSRPTLTESVVRTAAGFGAVETARASLNPLIDEEDVLYAIAAGAVVGGGLFHPLGRAWRAIKQGPLPPPEYIGGVGKGPWRPRLGGGYDGPAGPKGGGGSPSIIPPSPDGKMPTPEMFGLPAPHPKMRIPTHVPLEGPSGPSGRLPQLNAPQPASTHAFVIPPKGGGESVIVPHAEVLNKETGEMELAPASDPRPMFKSWHVLNSLHPDTKIAEVLKALEKVQVSKSELAYVIKGRQTKEKVEDLAKLEDWIEWHLSGEPRSSIKLESFHLETKTAIAVYEHYGELYKKYTGDDYFLKARRSWKATEDATMVAHEVHKQEVAKELKPIEDAYTREREAHMAETINMFSGIFPETNIQVLRELVESSHVKEGVEMTTSAYFLMRLNGQNLLLTDEVSAAFNRLDGFKIYNDHPEAILDMLKGRENLSEADTAILHKATDRLFNVRYRQDADDTFGMDSIAEIYTAEVEAKAELYQPQQDRWVSRVREIEALHEARLVAKIGPVPKAPFEILKKAIENRGELTAQTLVDNYELPMITIKSFLSPIESSITGEIGNLENHLDYLRRERSRLRASIQDEELEIKIAEGKIRYGESQQANPDEDTTEVLMEAFGAPAQEALDIAEQGLSEQQDNLAHVELEIKSHTDELSIATANLERNVPYKGAEISKVVPYSDARYKNLPVNITVIEAPIVNWERRHSDEYDEDINILGKSGLAWVRWSATDKVGRDTVVYENQNDQTQGEALKEAEMDPERKMLVASISYQNAYANIIDMVSKGARRIKFAGADEINAYSDGSEPSDWLYEDKLPTFYRKLAKAYDLNYQSFFTNGYPQRILRFTESEAKRFLDNAPRFLNPFVGRRSVVQKPAKALTPTEETIRELERLLPAEALDAIGFNVKFPREIMEQVMFQTVGADYIVPLRDDMGMAELKEIVARENLGVTHRSMKGLRERITLAREKKTSMEWLESKPIPPQGNTGASFDEHMAWEFDLALARQSLGDKVVDDKLARQAAERDVEGHIQRQAAVTQPDLRPVIVPQSVADNFPEITEETGFVIVPDGGIMAPTGGGEKPPTVPPTADGTTPPPSDPEPTPEPLPFEDVLKIMYEVIPAAGMENMRGGAKFAYSLSYLLGRSDGPTSLRFLHHFALQTLVSPVDLQGENVPVGIAADMKADSLTRADLSKVGEEVQGLFDSWYTENKHRFPFIGGEKAVRLRNAQEDFYRQVFEGLHGKPITDLRVQLSVDAFNKANARNAKKIHESGLSETLLESEGYAPHSWLVKQVGNNIRLYGLDVMTSLFRDGLLKLNPHFTERQATLIAKSLLINVNTRGLDVDYESTSGVGEDSFAALERKLSAVPDITAEEIAEILSVTKKVPNKPSFLRNRTELDIFTSQAMRNKETGEMDTVSIIDMLNTNAASLLVHHQRQLNGQLMYREMMTELAKFLGKPEATWDDLKELAKFEMLQRGENNAETMELIEHVQRIVLGIPIDPAQGKWGEYARILQKFSLAAFGATFGIAALAEGGQAVAMSSLESMQRMFPEMQAIMMDVLAGNMTKSELARELQNYAGIAHPKFGRGTNMNREFDHIAEDVQGMVESLLDFLGEKALSFGGLLALDTMQRLWSAILFTDNLVNGVLAGGMPYSRIHLAQIGLTPDMAYRVVAMIKKHGKLYDAVNGGKKIGRCHPENWEDVEAAESFRWALNLHSRRTIHEAMKGQYHHKFQGQIGRLFWQFRTFMLSAYEGQAVTAVQGMQHGDKRAAFGLLTNSMFAGLSYIAGVLVRYGHDEEKVKKYLTMEQIAKGMLVKSGWFTIGMPILDSVQRFRGESPLFSYAHTNTGLASSALMGSPSVAIADALAGVVKSVVAPVTNPNYKYSKQDWRNIETLAPLHGLIGWGNSLKMIGDRLPEKSKGN